MKCEFGACGDIGNTLVQGAAVNGAWCSKYPSICQWIKTGLIYLKTHPITLSANELAAAQVTYQHSTKSLCVNVGAGASFPPSKAFTVGALNAGDMDHWQDVESSWGYSYGANLFAGYQGSFNSSGKVGGPTVSGVGISGSYTWGGCTSF